MLNQVGKRERRRISLTLHNRENYISGVALGGYLWNQLRGVVYRQRVGEYTRGSIADFKVREEELSIEYWWLSVLFSASLLEEHSFASGFDTA